MKPIRGWWMLVVMLTLGLLVPPAWADDPALAAPKDPAARQHYTQGNRLYRIRKFDEAITEYQAGAVIELAPVFDYNLGQCYRQLGRYADASWHYERFIKNGVPASELQTVVSGFLQQMRAELERKALTQPPTEVASETGLPRTARRGSSSTPSIEPPTSIIVRGTATIQWYSDRIGWSLVAGGMVGAGTATYLFVCAHSLLGDANATPEEDRRSELLDAWHTRKRIGTVAGIGSVALLVAGVVRLAIHSGEPARSTATSWSVGANAHGAFVFGRF